MLCELLLGGTRLRREFLEPSRHAHGPCHVTEVTADLALNRRHGKGGKFGPAGGVIAVNGVDQADVADAH